MRKKKKKGCCRVGERERERERGTIGRKSNKKKAIYLL